MVVTAADSSVGEWTKWNRQRRSEGVECFSGRNFARGNEIGEGVLDKFYIPKERERRNEPGVGVSGARQ
jgi:hypothetical protein